MFQVASATRAQGAETQEVKLLVEDVKWRFYDANEDNGGSETAWHLEIESANLDLLLTDALELQGHHQDRTIGFFEPGSRTSYHLVFHSAATLEKFVFDAQMHCKENMGLLNVDDGSPDDPVLTVPMLPEWGSSQDGADSEAPPPMAEQSSAHVGRAVVGLALGAGERSFVLKDGALCALKNTEERLQAEEGLVVALEDSAGKPLAARKPLLTGAERQMRLLDVNDRSAVRQVLHALRFSLLAVLHFCMLRIGSRLPSLCGQNPIQRSGCLPARTA